MFRSKTYLLILVTLLITVAPVFALQELVFQPSSNKKVNLGTSPNTKSGKILLPPVTTENQTLTLLSKDSASVTVSPPLLGGGTLGVDFTNLQLDRTADYSWSGSHSWSGRFTPPSGENLPQTCTPPEMFISTGSPTGRRLYVCETDDTWVLQGDGQAELGSGGDNYQVQYNFEGSLAGSSDLTFENNVLAVQSGVAIGAATTPYALTATGVVYVPKGALPVATPSIPGGYGLLMGTDSGSTGESRILTYASDQATFLSFWTNANGASAAERARFSTSGNFTLMPLGTGSGATHALNFRELAANGSNTVGIKAPDSLSGDLTLTLPQATPTASAAGYLKGSTSGVLSFAQPAFSDISGTVSVSQGGNGGAPSAADQVAVSGSSSTATWTSINNCTTGLTYNTSTHAFGCASAGGTGTVTSVGLSAPAEFTVSNSPVTTTGTLTFAKANQNANLVYAGPSSGAAAAPSFRSLVNDDLPTISSSNKVDWTAVNKTGSNLGDLGPVLQTVLYSNLSGISSNGSEVYCSDCTKTSPCAGSGTGAIARRLNGTWECGVGTVTSVGVTVPSEFSATSAVTSSGSVTISKANQAVGLVYAAPPSPNPTGTPGFRSLVANDMPTGISAANIGDGSVSSSEFQTLSDISTGSTVQSQLSGKVSTSTTVSSGTGLTGGGALSSNQTLSFDYSKTIGTNPALQANECVFSTSGILCEGSTADTVEVLLAFPDPSSSDKTVTLPNATTTLVGNDTSDTLTNKTLTSPVISTITNTGTLTLPTSTTTLVGRDTTDTLTNKTLTSPVISTITNAGTLTLPTATTTLVGTSTTDTLTNKTLTTPKITASSSINDTNGNELIRVPSLVASAVNDITVSNAASGGKPSITTTGDDTNITLNLVPKGTGTIQANGVDVVTTSDTQTLTNKTLTSPTLTTPSMSSIVNTGTLTLPTTSTTLIGTSTTDTLTNKTFTAPKITSASSINDSNGNELLKFPSAVSSAVNEITISNTASNGKPSITASGDDTNITLNLVPKGTGTIQANGVDVVTTSGSQTLTNKTLTSPVISTITNTGTLTLPTATTTLVGTGTTDTLTNKTLTSPALQTASTWTGTLSHTNTSSAATGTPLSINVSESGATTTDAVNGASIVFAQGDNAVATDTNAGLSVVVATASDNADTLIGVDIGGLNTSQPTTIGLRVQSGFDYGATITGEVDLTQPTAGTPVFQMTTDAATGSNTDPFEAVYQNRCTTTDAATVTNCGSVVLTSNTSNLLECKIIGRRTGGSAGTAGESYSVWRAWPYKGDGTLFGNGIDSGGRNIMTNNYPMVSPSPTPGITASASGGSMVVQITGIANNNITWNTICRHSYVGS